MNRAAFYHHLMSFIRRATTLAAVLLVATTLIAARPATATITSMIGFRGVLRSSSGSVVADGNYTMIFVLYSASSGGSCLYTARGSCGTPTAKTISVTNGYFQTLLGESGDNTLDLTFNTNSFYLELIVNGETMSPRRQLASASQAFNANLLGGLAASSVVQSDADDYVSGLLTYSLPPSGTGIGSGTIWINPASTSSNRTILGISAATSTLLFNLDSEGDLSILGNLAPYNNNWSSLGGFGNAFTNVYSSGTAYLGTVSSTLISGWKNNATDLGAYGFAFRNVYVSGSVTSGSIYPTLSSAYDLGSFGGGPLGAAWRNLYTSGTIFAGTVSSTLITPWTNNTTDLGALGNAFRNIYASGSVTAAYIYPTLPNAYDLGGYVDAWRALYASGAVYVGSQAASSSLSGGTAIVSQAFLPSNNNTVDVGAYGIALRNIYASGVLYAGTLNVSSTATSTFLGGVQAAGLSSSNGLTITGGSIIGNGNNQTDIGAYGFAFRNIYTSGSVTSGHHYPTLPNTYDLGGWGGGPLGAAWRDLYTSGTIFAGTVSSTLITGYSNNVADLGVYGNAWRDLYASGIIRAGAFQSASTSNFTDFQAVPARAGLRVETSESTSLGGSNGVEYGLYSFTSSSFGISSGNYTAHAVRGALQYAGVQTGGSLSLNGVSGQVTIAPGMSGTISSVTPIFSTVSISVSSSITNAIGVDGSYSFGSGGVGSFIGTSTGVRGTYRLGQSYLIDKAYGVLGFPRGAAGTIRKAVGVYGAANYGSSTYAGYFSLAPVWIDADDTADVSDHGASNTPGALFVGGIAELNSNVFIDGPFQASSTAMFSLGATSSHIYPWTNNAHDLGAYGNAWRDIYVSGTVTSASHYPWQNNAFDLGLFGATWRNIYVSGSIYVGSQAASSSLTNGTAIVSQAYLPSANNSVDIGQLGLAIRNIYASGSVTAANIYPTLPNTYDFGSYAAPWRDIYASGTVTSAAVRPWQNNIFDLGLYGAAWRNVYVSGSVTAGNIYPTLPNTYDLGGFGGGPLGAAWRSLYASGSLLVGTNTASSSLSGGTAIVSQAFLPSSNNAVDIGQLGLAIRNIYASGSVTAANIYPTLPNTYDLGSYAAAWRDIYASGTAFLGNINASSTASSTFNHGLELSGVGSIRIGGNVYPSANVTYDLGAYGAAWNGLYVSGTSFLASLRTATILPHMNNLYDLGAFNLAFRNLYVSGTFFGGTVSSTLITGYSNNATDLGALGNAFRNIYASGSVTAANIYPTLPNTYDLGSYAAAWRDIYASGSVTAASIRPWSNNAHDLGNYDAAWRNIYVSGTVIFGSVLPTLPNAKDLGSYIAPWKDIYASGTVTSAAIYPWQNNQFDLGLFGAAWKNLYVSSTARLDSVSSTIITPWKSNTFDLGARGNAWRSIFASTSIALVGDGGGGFNLTTGALTPVSANNFSIGTLASPLSHIFSSGTLFLGSNTASSTFTSATITLGNVGYDLPNFIFTSTGTFRASPADVVGNSAFVFDTSNNLTALGPTSTALIMLRENGTDRLSIVATSSEMVVFRSYVASNTVTMAKAVAFAFETVNYIPSSTNAIGDSNILLSIRNQNGPAESGAGIDSEFAVYSGGNVVADGSYTSAGAPGDVAEYVEVAGDPVEPGDVLVVDDATDGTYRKSSTAYSKDVAGVVATTPKFIIGAPNGTNAPLVLTGLAKVKVTDENGSISRGDLLVSSSRAGYAMRYNPATDTGSRLVAVLGVALEPLAAGEGSVQVLVRNAWVNNVTPSVQKISRDLLRVANTIGVRIDPIASDRELSVHYGPDGGLASGVNQDLAGKSIVGVAEIQGADGKWQITPDGTLIAYVETSRGTQKPYYAVGSPNVEFVISGTGRLENGEATVEFDPDVRDTLDEQTPPKVVVTPLAPTALYVSDKSSVGFHVKSLAAGAMDAEFDWIAIVRREGYGEDPEPPPHIPDNPGVADVSLPAGQAGLRSEASSTTSTPPLDIPPPEE